LARLVRKGKQAQGDVVKANDDFLFFSEETSDSSRELTFVKNEASRRAMGHSRSRVVAPPRRLRTMPTTPKSRVETYESPAPRCVRDTARVGTLILE
jgi:hypothetical protein